MAAGPKGIESAKPATIEAIQPANLTFETSEDGTRFIALRFHKDDAAATRVHISDMHLGAGEKLYVYSAGGARVYGPFIGAGPVESGDFWTEAVAGDVVVEFQAGSDVVADLPFTIDAIEAAEIAGAEPAGEESVRESRVSLYQGVPVQHEVIDGMAVYEGDILLGPASELRPADGSSKSSVRSAVAVTGSRYRWPNGTMPYVINSNIPAPERITNAINHWNTVMAGTVRMVPRTTESNYVSFVLASSAGTCSSYVGMLGYGSQAINVGGYCSTGNMIHEIGHAWGLWHEHTREDRDRYVVVNWTNINSTQSYNFNQNISNGDDIGAYDYNSVMHYNATAFSINGLPTLVTIPAGIPIGQRAGLSTGDIAAIRLLYPATAVPAPQPGAASVSITSNPLGSSISIDNTSYTAPATFNWAPGSSHTLVANDSTANGVRRTFTSWSNAGAQTQTIVAPDSSTTLKAEYAVSYSVVAKPGAGGTTYTYPSSAAGYYPAGSTVTVGGNPAAGYCFSNWKGLIAGTPNRVNLSVTKPYDLTANFQKGSITLTASVLYPTAAGANYTIGISATSGCTWGVYSTASWVAITSAQSGSGPGTLTIAVAPNTTSAARTAQVAVGHKTFVVSQAGVL
jgi:astacin